MSYQNNHRAVSMQFFISYATLLFMVTNGGALLLLACNASVIYPNYDIGHIGGDHHITEPINTASAAAAATAALFTASVGHPAQRTPIKTAQDIMVDITNRFAFSVMNAHTERSAHRAGAFERHAKHDNFVFSPCGLTSVLIALYEGSNGQSAYEIYRAMRLPWDRDIVRVGVRDIHRRLRVYFYDNTNLLDGLSLSQDNVTIREDYETILRFYGYNLNPDTMVFNEKTTTMALKPPNLSTTPIFQTSTQTSVDMRMLEDMDPTLSTEKITTPIEKEMETTTQLTIRATTQISSLETTVSTSSGTESKPTQQELPSTDDPTNKEIPSVESTSTKYSTDIPPNVTPLEETTPTSSDINTSSVMNNNPTEAITTESLINSKDAPFEDTTPSFKDRTTSPVMSENPIESITTESSKGILSPMITQIPLAETTTTSTSLMQPSQPTETIELVTQISTMLPINDVSTEQSSQLDNTIPVSTNRSPEQTVSENTFQTTTNDPEIKTTKTTTIVGIESINPTIFVGNSNRPTTVIADKIEYPVSTTQIVFTSVNDKMEFPSNQLDQESRLEPDAISKNPPELDQTSAPTSPPATTTDFNLMTTESGPNTATTLENVMPIITDSPITIIRLTTNLEDSFSQTKPTTFAPITARTTTIRPDPNLVTIFPQSTISSNDLSDFKLSTSTMDATKGYPETTTMNDVITLRPLLSRQPLRRDQFMDSTTDYPETTTTNDVTTLRPLLSRLPLRRDQFNRNSRTLFSDTSNAKEPNSSSIAKPIKPSNNSSSATYFFLQTQSTPVFNRVRITRKRINKRSVFHLPYTNLGQEYESEFAFNDYATFHDPFNVPQPNNIRIDPNIYTSNTYEESEFPLPFHVTKHETIQAPFKRFNTLLRLGYVPSLRASVLELPLDSDKYIVLLLLPDQAFDLNGVMQRMSTVVSPTIREIRSEMRQFWIKASVPKFFLKGNVILTGDLMTLGIKSIFDPSHADFTPLTDELGIYAKHIEQMVTMNIRTHASNLLRRNIVDADLYKPIEVNVQQPFVFCVVDQEIDLAIMIGQIVNPLNSRIL